MLRPYQATPGGIIDYDDLTEIVMDLNYDEWGSLGREESNIPERIEENYQYKLIKIPADSRVGWNSIYDFDLENAEYIRNKILETKSYPPIVLDVDMDVIDGWHRAYSVFKLLKQPFIWGWIPID